MVILSLSLFFYYNYSNSNFSVDEYTDEVNQDIGVLSDSLMTADEDSSVFLEGKVLPNEGFNNTLLALDGIKMEHILEISSALKPHVDFRFLIAGEGIIVEMDQNKVYVKSFSYIPNPVTTHKLTRNIDGALEYELILLPTEKRYRYVRGQISSTLNQALFEANLEPSIAATVNGVLECMVNFRTDARKGDSFKVFLEEGYYNGIKLKGGNVMLASYEGKRTGYKVAYSFTDIDKNSAFNAHYSRQGDALINASMRMPVDRIHITSPYGYRIHPVTRTRSLHYGVDYRGSVGDPVYSVAPGTVLYSGYDGINGNKVVIKHSDKTQTFYLHLKKSLVTVGQKVKSRQKIALLGNTGRSTGPHLHFSIKDSKGKWSNPMSKRMIATQKLDGERYARFLTQMDDIDKLIKDQVNREKKFTEHTLFHLGNDRFVMIDPANIIVSNN